MKMRLFLLFTLAFGSKQRETVAEEGTAYGKSGEISADVVKIEEDEYQVNKRSSQYIGVFYHRNRSKWTAHRWSKNEKKTIYSGNYGTEELAAHASDTLARQLIKNDEEDHTLNFPGDETEVHIKLKKRSSEYFGVTFDKRDSKWKVQRRSKIEKKMVYNGSYDTEEKAAHASDTLARKLIKDGEEGHKLNLADDDTEVHREKRKKYSEYSGLTYDKNKSKWRIQRRSKIENKIIYDGYYKDEEKAARASDSLARKLMEKGEEGHKLNFADDDTEMHREKNKKKRKREEILGNLQDN